MDVLSATGPSAFPTSILLFQFLLAHKEGGIEEIRKDLAREMGGDGIPVSRPAMTNMLLRYKESGMVESVRHGTYRLSEAGKEVASRQRHYLAAIGRICKGVK